MRINHKEPSSKKENWWVQDYMASKGIFLFGVRHNMNCNVFFLQIYNSSREILLP